MVLPSGIISTGFPAVRATCAEIGIRFDDWQEDLNRLILAKGASGEYAADTVVMSIPRQVGKTFDVGALVFADSIIAPGTTTVWTAHRFKVSRETFNELRGLARSPLLAAHIDPDEITSAAGNECIPFRNGSRIVFAARERGAIRGFTKVRRLVLDEAQILTESALSDMAPTMNQAENPQAILMGTPPKPGDPSEVFTNLRREALDGSATGLLYVEFSAEPGSRPDDRAAWRQANPSYPRRTSTKAIQRMRKLLSEDDFRREALGIWDEQSLERPVISPALWGRLARPDAPEGRLSYGVKFSPDGETVALAVAVRHDLGVHVEGVDHRRVVHGTQWLVDWLSVRLADATVVVDGKAGSGALVRALAAAGVPERKVTVPTADQAVAAHAAMLEAVVEGTVSHLGDPVLDAAVASAGRRPIGKAGGWGFQSLDGGDVTLLEAATLALYGAQRKRGGGRSTGGRKAVLLS